MTTSLFFVVPAHGRIELASICLRALERTCAVLRRGGIDATAIVIADDENLETAAELGFWTYERPNRALGRKFNDGYEIAAREGADYVVPIGSDDWIDPRLILEAPLPEGAIRCARLCTMVAEDGETAMSVRIHYDGGIGIRILPVELLRPLRYRPAMEERRRAVDASTLIRLRRHYGRRGVPLVYFDLDPLQLVDFKSPVAQLNSFKSCRVHGVGPEGAPPWDELAERYSPELVADVRSLYARHREAVAA